MSITQPECVFVALGIKHAKRMRHIFVYDLLRYTVFFHIISETARFSKKKVIECNIICVFEFPYKVCPKHFYSKKN